MVEINVLDNLAIGKLVMFCIEPAGKAENLLRYGVQKAEKFKVMAFEMQEKSELWRLGIKKRHKQ